MVNGVQRDERCALRAGVPCSTTDSAALFPDDPTAFESGGSRFILTLTTEGSLEEPSAPLPSRQRLHHPVTATWMPTASSASWTERYPGSLGRERVRPLTSTPWAAGPVAPRRWSRPWPLRRRTPAPPWASSLRRAAERERIVAADILMDAIMGAMQCAPEKGASTRASPTTCHRVCGRSRGPALRRGVPAGRPAQKPPRKLRAIVEAEARRLADGGSIASWCGRPLPCHGSSSCAERNFGYSRRRGAGHVRHGRMAVRRRRPGTATGASRTSSPACARRWRRVLRDAFARVVPGQRLPRLRRSGATEATRPPRRPRRPASARRLPSSRRTRPRPSARPCAG